MIFSPENISKILAGKKTETRRIMKPGETECRYKPGRNYAVQPGRGKYAGGRILVTEVWSEPLGWIDDNGAAAEGFKSRAEFFQNWTKLHGSTPLKQPVWVIRFEVVS